jgi:hypothetical protein
MFEIQRCPECEHRHIEGSITLFHIAGYRVRIWWAMQRPRRWDWPPADDKDDRYNEMWKGIYPPTGHFSHSFTVGPFEIEWPDREHRRFKKMLRGGK